MRGRDECECKSARACAWYLDAAWKAVRYHDGAVLIVPRQLAREGAHSHGAGGLVPAGHIAIGCLAHGALQRLVLDHRRDAAHMERMPDAAREPNRGPRLVHLKELAQAHRAAVANIRHSLGENLHLQAHVDEDLKLWARRDGIDRSLWLSSRLWEKGGEALGD
jgi:hypothetical protein